MDGFKRIYQSFMDLQTKKIIAKEFLVFIITLLIGVVAFLSVYPYNSFRQHQLSDVNQEISIKQSLADSLNQISSQYILNEDGLPIFIYSHSQQQYLLNNTYQALKNNLSGLTTPQNKYDSLMQNDIDYRQRAYKALLENVKGFKLSYAVFVRVLSVDSLKSENEPLNYEQLRNESTKLKTEIGRLKYNEYPRISSQILSFNNQLHFTLIIFLISVFILFILRYIYYGIKWSMKIIKQ
jgi:hypothetical protein